MRRLGTPRAAHRRALCTHMRFGPTRRCGPALSSTAQRSAGGPPGSARIPNSRPDRTSCTNGSSRTHAPWTSSTRRSRSCWSEPCEGSAVAGMVSSHADASANVACGTSTVCRSPITDAPNPRPGRVETAAPVARSASPSRSSAAIPSRSRSSARSMTPDSRSAATSISSSAARVSRVRMKPPALTAPSGRGGGSGAAASRGGPASRLPIARSSRTHALPFERVPRGRARRSRPRRRRRGVRAARRARCR